MNWKVALTEKSEDPEGELMETSHILVFFKTPDCLGYLPFSVQRTCVEHQLYVRHYSNQIRFEMVSLWPAGQRAGDLVSAPGDILSQLGNKNVSVKSAGLKP